MGEPKNRLWSETALADGYMGTRRPSPIAALLLVLALAWAGPGHLAPLAAAAAPAGVHAGAAVHGDGCPCGHVHGAGAACELGCPQCAQCHGVVAAAPVAAVPVRVAPAVRAVPRPTEPMPAVPFRPPRA